jgi:hypothetical protein
VVVVLPPLVPAAAVTIEQWKEDEQVAPAQLQSAALLHQLLAGVLANWQVCPEFQSHVRPPQVALQSLSTLQGDPTPTVPPVVPPPLVVLAAPVVLPPVVPAPVVLPPPVVPVVAPPVVVPVPPVVPLAGSTMEQWLPLQVAPLQLQSRSAVHQLWAGSLASTQ